MPDARAEYARRFVERIALRRTDWYWPTEKALRDVSPVRAATAVEAWAERLGLSGMTWCREDVA